jgi:hypothetical protein
MCPLKTWLFCDQYFESLSLIVNFKWKEVTRKITRILNPVVSVLIALLYFTSVGIIVKYFVLKYEKVVLRYPVSDETLDFWDNWSNKFY